MAKVRLNEILNIDALQRLQDSFAAVTGITTVILAPDGQPLTRTSNLHGFCARMYEYDAGAEKCRLTNGNLCAENQRTGKAAIVECPHSDLVTAAVPIQLNGEYLGSWVIGQARIGNPSPTVLQRTEKDLKLQPGTLVSAMEELPVLSREEFDNIFAFLKALSATVVELGHANHAMAARNVELERLAEQLDSTAQMLRHFINSSDVGMYITDFETGEVLLVNDHFAKLTGTSAEEAIGKKCWTIAGEGGDSFCSLCPRDKLLDGDSYEWENYNERIGQWLRSVNQAIRWVDGRLAHMVTVWNITKQKQMQEELAHLAYFDQQMHLPNGLRLAKDLNEGGADCFLIAFDIVKLRHINDTYGRETGDALLLSAADWVGRQAFADTCFYRIEGDQFCLRFDSADAEAADQMAATIFERFSRPWNLTLGGQALSVLCGVSVGILDVRKLNAEESILNLLARTLDVARAEDRIVVHDDEMDNSYKQHLEFERELRRCVNNGFEGFAVHFQPIVEVASGAWKGLEALCRWESPRLGRFSPLVFIQEAEQLGLIGLLGDWVLETALCHCKAWKLDQVEGFFLSVNASPLQMLDEGFPTRVRQLLDSYDYPSNKLSLEITETTEVTFNEHTTNIIDRLRFNGVLMALDDFGTGYSSFNNLKHLPVSFLKTERAFIEGIEQDSYMQYFYYIMSQLAHATDMKLIAEGVETREQLEIIIKNGADYIQGYYFSKPLPPEELEKQLGEFSRVNVAFFSLKPEEFTADELGNSSDSYMVTPNLFRIINRSMQALLAADNMDDAFEEVLQITGKYLNVSRAYIFQQDEGVVFSNTHEWCNVDVAPQKGNLTRIDVTQLAPSWLPRLKADGMIVASDINLLPKDVYEALVVQDIRAIVVLPILDGDKLIAFAGFDDKHNREWLPEEIILLRNLCSMMGSSVRRRRLEKELVHRNEMLEDILNSLDLSICITDPDTDDILWANETLRGVFSGNTVRPGQKCYEVLQNEKGHCSFCRVDQLVDNPLIKQVQWEHHNKALDRHYSVHDSLIRWAEGKRAHLEYARDITEMRKAKEQLEYFASTDSLTGTMNRKRLMETLEEQLALCDAAGESLSLVFVDVDKLKYVNDTFGHTHGDLLIQNTVAAIKSVLREQDFLGRLGGDEFVALLPGVKRADAEELAAQARKKLAAMPLADVKEDCSFSYGVCESAEVQGSGRVRIDRLFEQADRHMRRFKRAAYGELDSQ